VGHQGLRDLVYFSVYFFVHLSVPSSSPDPADNVRVHSLDLL